MSDRIIQTADLSGIQNSLSQISFEVQSLSSDVGTVNNNVLITADRLDKLTDEFHAYVKAQTWANRLNQAETRVVQIRQEIDKKFGHYDLVRRTTTGILQADDLGLVRKNTITTATEDLMISTPGYWLAPCLVALSAWINDNRDLADRAVKEAIRRDDEKTSLFFALVCRRADRMKASLEWVERYLSLQDEEDLDRKTMIILDAYAAGLFGADTEGLIARKIQKWLDHLSAKPGFVENQEKRWTEAINLKRHPIDVAEYPYLRKYSHTWPVLENVMEGAQLHSTIADYFQHIFDQKMKSGALKEQLDGILESLVTDYDDEELPLRKKEKLEQLIIDSHGDEDRANKLMAVEEKAFDEHKDFTQLLTDAAMNPEVSHSSVATQKFAISLSKDWIREAYDDICAENRSKVPHEIEINVDTFNDKTVDGSEEEAIIGRFNTLIDQEKTAALSALVMSTFDEVSDKAGIVVALMGIGLIFKDSPFLGVIAIVAGVLLFFHKRSKQKALDQARAQVSQQYEDKRVKGTEIVRATLAEVVDFRGDFAAKDGESTKVTDFLSELAPNQYVTKLADGKRHIQVQGVQ